MFSTILTSPKQLAYEVTSKLDHSMFCVTVMFRNKLGEARLATTTNTFGALSDADKEQRLQVMTQSYSRLFQEGFRPLVIFAAAPAGVQTGSTAGLQTLLTKDETGFSLVCECAPQPTYGSLLELKYVAESSYLRKLKPMFFERASTRAAVAEAFAAGKVLEFNSGSPFPVPGKKPLWQKDFAFTLPMKSSDTEDKGSASDPE